MRLTIKNQSINLNPNEFENAKVSFSLLHGRKFEVSEFKFSLNEIIDAVTKEALKSGQDNIELKEWSRVFTNVTEKGYAKSGSKNNFFVLLLAKIKHYFSKGLRNKLLATLNRTINPTSQSKEDQSGTKIDAQRSSSDVPLKAQPSSPSTSTPEFPPATKTSNLETSQPSPSNSLTNKELEKLLKENSSLTDQNISQVDFSTLEMNADRFHLIFGGKEFSPLSSNDKERIQSLRGKNLDVLLPFFELFHAGALNKEQIANIDFSAAFGAKKSSEIEPLFKLLFTDPYSQSSIDNADIPRIQKLQGINLDFLLPFFEMKHAKHLTPGQISGINFSKVFDGKKPDEKKGMFEMLFGSPGSTSAASKKRQERIKSLDEKNLKVLAEFFVRDHIELLKPDKRKGIDKGKLSKETAEAVAKDEEFAKLYEENKNNIDNIDFSKIAISSDQFTSIFGGPQATEFAGSYQLDLKNLNVHKLTEKNLNALLGFFGPAHVIALASEQYANINFQEALKEKNLQQKKELVGRFFFRNQFGIISDNVGAALASLNGESLTAIIEYLDKDCAAWITPKQIATIHFKEVLKEKTPEECEQIFAKLFCSLLLNKQTKKDEMRFNALRGENLVVFMKFIKRKQLFVDPDTIPSIDFEPLLKERPMDSSEILLFLFGDGENSDSAQQVRLGKLNQPQVKALASFFNDGHLKHLQEDLIKVVTANKNKM